MGFSSNAWNRIRYTLWAPVYDPIARAFQKERRRSIEMLEIQPGERVLIVGAGTGLDLEFVGAGPRITAIDLTPGMIRRLRRRARRLGLTMDARIMDAQALQFPDGGFDAAILHLILAVIPDPGRCLKEVARVLRPAGRAVILDKFVSSGSRPPAWARWLNPLARVLCTNLTRRFEPILAGSGFEIVEEVPLRWNGLLKIILLRKAV
jgi:ubiquinone/menaquinone biosynthesis C-methylase UbiE